MENKNLILTSGWVETPKLRRKPALEKRNAVSVPNTPQLEQSNHFNILSPSPNKKKRKKHGSQKKNSPLSQEILEDFQWDDHSVPCNELDGLKIIHNTPVLDSTPSPVPQSSPPVQSTKPQPRQISFLEYLKDELTVADFDSVQELKRERITNFLAVPASIEKLMGFGFFVCLDSFLYTFTILPLRFCLAFYHYLIYIYKNSQVLFKKRERFVRLKSSQKCDLLKGCLILITCFVMSFFDPSRVYHSIRGQNVLKLYVVFNVLEICDKLCSAVGVDILDALFSKSTLGSTENNRSKVSQLSPVTLFILAAGYLTFHTIIIFFQMITLNVAINFYSNALLSLLISNQFVEIKQSVFKRFEKENLFQLSCADIVERFQQYAFLFIITLRNVIELSESGPSSIMPSTFVPLFKLPASTSLNTLMTPVVMVIVSELMVDWLKHAFIAKFNQIRPSIYGKYIDILCKDLVVGSPGRISQENHAFVDQSPVVSRRIGFPVLPLACLYIRMMQQILPMMFMSQNKSPLAATLSQLIKDYVTLDSLPIKQVIWKLNGGDWLESGLGYLIQWTSWGLLVTALAIVLLALKIVVGIRLLGFAYKRYSSMQEREAEDKKAEERMKEMARDQTEYNQSVRDYLSQPEDYIMGEIPKKYTLENIDRFSMAKSRIP